jgi:hypothetical protein
MRPKPFVVTATTDTQQVQVGPGLKAVMIKNIGSNDVYIDFDNTVDTNNSYVLESGETLSVEYSFIQLFYKALTGTSKMHVIKIIQ